MKDEAGRAVPSGAAGGALHAEVGNGAVFAAGADSVQRGGDMGKFHGFTSTSTVCSCIYAMYCAMSVPGRTKKIRPPTGSPLLSARGCGGTPRGGAHVACDIPGIVRPAELRCGPRRVGHLRGEHQRFPGMVPAEAAGSHEPVVAGAVGGIHIGAPHAPLAHVVQPAAGLTVQHHGAAHAVRECFQCGKARVRRGRGHARTEQLVPRGGAPSSTVRASRVLTGRSGQVRMEPGGTSSTRI